MVIIWTHDDGTDQSKDTCKVNDISEESNMNNSADEVTKSSHSEKILNNSDSCKIHSEKEVTNADVHNENEISNEIDGEVKNDSVSKCNGVFKNRASHFSYKKHTKHKVSMLIHRHTL